MDYRVAVEDMEPGSFVAWVLDLPGCFSTASSEDEAVAGVPNRIAEYYAWLVNHDLSLPILTAAINASVIETFRSFASSDDPDYLVNAFFDDDRRALTYWDIVVGSRLLRWSRQDLLQATQSIQLEQLHRPIVGEIRGSIAGILEHIAGAENWYLEQLDMELNWTDLPDDALGKLQAVRARTEIQLATMVNMRRITEDRGEMWSARKLLRRALWHERAHTRQITRILTSSP